MALTLWWTWTLQAWAAPPPADPDLARLSGPLRQASGLVTPLERLDWAALRPGAQGADTVQVVVELEPAADPEGVAESVAWLDPDLVVELVRPDALQLRVPHSALVAVAATAGVERVREPHYARAHAVTSEGVDQTFLLDWHDDGVTGEGVQVAILDIGFAGWTNVGDDEIPSDTTDGTTSGWQQSDHGTAVTEIVHDMAPDAELGLFNFQTDQEYVDRMEQIVNDGWQVVNASVGFDNVWHADGTSPYAQTVDWAVDNGVVYVAAAGNEGYNYVSGELTDKIDDDGRSESDGWVEINGHNGIWLPVAGGQAEASLRWTDPMGASSNDFDLVLFYDDADTSDDNVCGRSEETQDGTGDPYELAVCASSDSWVYARVVFHGEEADFPANREGFLYCFYGVDEEVATTSRTLTLPGDAAGAITVGAYRSTGELAWYSSQGPTEDGRTKPDLVAPTAVSTKIYGSRSATEGTSFAAPHVTGAAALLLDVDRRMDPQEVKDYLRDNAEDLGPDGPDTLYGWGAVTLREQPEGCGCSSTGRTSWGLALWLPLLLAGVRRRP